MSNCLEHYRFLVVRVLSRTAEIVVIDSFRIFLVNILVLKREGSPQHDTKVCIKLIQALEDPFSGIHGRLYLLERQTNSEPSFVAGPMPKRDEL